MDFLINFTLWGVGLTGWVIAFLFGLSVVIFAFVFSIYGRQTTSARVDPVVPYSAAAAAGLMPGDIVLAIDGRKIESFSDMQRLVSANAGRTLALQIDRGGVPVTLSATP